jgi:hypothetical protein
MSEWHCCIAGRFPWLPPTRGPMGAGAALPERPEPTGSNRHEGGSNVHAVASTPQARERRGLPAVEPEEDETEKAPSRSG